MTGARLSEPEMTVSAWYTIERFGYPYTYSIVERFDGPGCARAADRHRAHLAADPNLWVPADAIDYGVDDVTHGEKVVILPT